MTPKMEELICEAWSLLTQMADELPNNPGIDDLEFEAMTQFIEDDILKYIEKRLHDG